jgi:SAM-dependent methyltransferase
MGLASSFFATAPGRALGGLIHARALAGQERSQSLATSLFRNIRQLSAFEGPLADIPARGAMTVMVAGCSLGCEAYTLAGYLAARFPTSSVNISAFDIDPGAIAHARRGIYGLDHLSDAVARGPHAAIVDALLVREGDSWRVRIERAAKVSFSVGDALADRPAERGAYDAVFAQNFMVHMPDDMARRALKALAACVRPGGAMFLGGMMLDMRGAATSAEGLTPVDWNIRDIHDEDTVRRNAWPFAYWSLEPLDDSRADWRQRYSTIFRKG